MPTTPPADLSPVALATVALATIFGPVALPLASTYAVIAIAAFVGSLIGLARRAPMSASRTLCFVLVMMFASVGCTVPMAQWVASTVNQPPSWLMFPVSLAIAAIGDDWLKLVPVVVGMIANRFRGPKNES